MYSERTAYFETKEEYDAGVPTNTRFSVEPVPSDDDYYMECDDGYTLLRPVDPDREVIVEYLGDYHYHCGETSCQSEYSFDFNEWTGSCSNPHFPYEDEQEDDVQ